MKAIGKMATGMAMVNSWMSSTPNTRVNGRITRNGDSGVSVSLTETFTKELSKEE
jgi:hypothetical protein